VDQTAFIVPMAAEEPLARTGLREQVTHRILMSVFEGRFHSGERLVVSRLSELFHVSPTPVRESLVELAGLGIVDLLPNRGAVVRPFGPPQLREMSQVRRILEVEAVRCACGNMTASDIKFFQNEFHELDKAPVNAQRDTRAQLADTRLHSTIAEKCQNPRLTTEVLKYLILFRALRNVSHLRDAWSEYRRVDDVPEHLKIVNALAAGNEDRAAKAMEMHIRSVEKTMGELVFSSDHSAKRGKAASS
jgi:DNA-binding GntR family transcriptional regulator